MQTFIQPQIHRFETTRHKEKQCNWLDWLSSDDLDVGQTNKQEATVQSLLSLEIKEMSQQILSVSC